MVHFLETVPKCVKYTYNDMRRKKNLQYGQSVG